MVGYLSTAAVGARPRAAPAHLQRLAARARVVGQPLRPHRHPCRVPGRVVMLTQATSAADLSEHVEDEASDDEEGEHLAKTEAQAAARMNEFIGASGSLPFVPTSSDVATMPRGFPTVAEWVGEEEENSGSGDLLMSSLDDDDLPALADLNDLPAVPLDNCACDGCVAVMVKFVWRGAWGGKKVCLAGSFNEWADVPIERAPNGDFMVALSLEPGTYQYKFKVDGRWLTSLEEPRVGDEKGNVNNQVTVAEAVTYKWRKEWGGREVYVSGSDSNWTERSRLEKDTEGNFTLVKSLPVGTYQYKFLVDGQWRCSPDEPTQRNDKNNLNNCVTVASDASVTVFYQTGWKTPKLLVPNGMESFTEVPMGRATSAGWMKVRVPAAPGYLRRRAQETSPATRQLAAPDAPPLTLEEEEEEREVPALEFIIAGAEGKHDLPPAGGLYKCPHPGGYKLFNGKLIPFTRARRAPVMIVTDLDGTLIGDGPEFDEGTHEFKQYWEDSAGLAGGLLVFNTGRSIGQVVALFTEKAGYMAMPNYIITAVGTKIFERNKKYDHTTVEGWQECESWASELEQGWDLQRVREVVEGQIQANPNQAHWLDRGTEHPHRCSLSAEHSVLERVLPGLRTAFNEQGLDVKIIVSGVGDWRYVDCVSAGGGKLEALEWVRRRVGLPAEHCVACGDSGNDVLMLEGRNRAIVVGNAQPDLVDWVMDQPQTGRVFLASKKGARGILEGLAGLALW